MDRENVGGNQSGQQSLYVSRGGNTFNNKWSLDGIDITDMAATGASPAYFDFDAFEEMTINTGGVDVTQQTGGVGINLVTKSGTDRFKGSSRFYRTNETFESNNIDSGLRAQGATAGSPIQDIKDYGIEAGGPLRRGRAWVWGSFGKQNIGVGVPGFYKPEPSCQALKTASVALATSIDEINGCLNTDLTVLQTTNLKGEVQLFKGNKLSHSQRPERVRPGNVSAFVQDTFTRNRLTLQLGIRYDRSHHSALAASIGANPLSTQWLPGIKVAGADPDVVFQDASPRVGLTYA